MRMQSYGLRGALAACGLIVVSTIAHAQAPAPKAQPPAAQAPKGPVGPPPSPTAIGYVREILDLKNVQTIYQSAIPALVQRARNALLQNNLGLQKDIDESAVKVAKDLAGREKEVGEQFVKIYSYTFSEPELKEILTFLKTPTGKKMIELEPFAYQQANAFMTDWSTAMVEEANNKIRAEMKARGKPVF